MTLKVEKKRQTPVIEVYAYYDTEGKIYDIPFFARTSLQAKRRMEIDIKAANEKTVIAMFPEKFELYFIGYYDQDQGILEPNGPKIVIKGSEIVK